MPHHMQHNAEPEAVDLLLEVDSIPLLNQYVDEANCDRTCRYLTAVATYLPVPDDQAALTAAYDAYMKIGKLHDAMRVALTEGDRNKIEEVFVKCSDGLEKQQLGYLLARQGIMLDCDEGRCAIEDESLREKVCHHVLLLAYISAIPSVRVLMPRHAAVEFCISMYVRHSHQVHNASAQHIFPLLESTMDFPSSFFRSSACEASFTPLKLLSIPLLLAPPNKAV